MFSRRLSNTVTVLVISISCPFFRATGQALITARQLIGIADSIAASYASNAKVTEVSASNIDTNGNAAEWYYTYHSLDSISASVAWTSAYIFGGQNNQVKYVSGYGKDSDTMYISKQWMDSDSAMLIAQRAEGSSIRKQFPTCTISALLSNHPFWIPNREDSTVWTVQYSCLDDSTRTVQINAITGDIVGKEVTMSANLASDLPVPIRFELRQNYPNPFNPSTNISFSVPIRSFVSLTIFDLLGRELTSLVSEELTAGKYSRRWNASMFPSGIYFCRLQSGSYAETRRLLLLK